MSTLRSSGLETVMGIRNCEYCHRPIRKGETCFSFHYGSSYYQVNMHLCNHCLMALARGAADESPEEVANDR